MSDRVWQWIADVAVVVFESVHGPRIGLRRVPFILNDLIQLV